MLPGVADQTEHIHIRSVVGRFLEHSRVYCFGQGENCKLYISSGDLMTRNTERRVEIGCPILPPHLRRQILSMLEVMFGAGRRLFPAASTRGVAQFSRALHHPTASVPAASSAENGGRTQNQFIFQPVAQRPQTGLTQSFLSILSNPGAAVLFAALQM